MAWLFRFDDERARPNGTKKFTIIKILSVVFIFVLVFRESSVRRLMSCSTMHNHERDARETPRTRNMALALAVL